MSSRNEGVRGTARNGIAMLHMLSSVDYYNNPSISTVSHKLLLETYTTDGPQLDSTYYM
jgi:hypothetical protein